MQINCLYLCMENLKDTKTADLIAEWVKIKKDDLVIEDVCLRWNTIATELDMRCVEAGISIVDGFPTFVCIIRESVVSRGIPFTTITVDVDAAELHALSGWLLLKEGGKG